MMNVEMLPLNAGDVPELAKVSQLNELPGAYTNLECRLPNGSTGNAKTYYGTQVEKTNNARCYDTGAELIAWIKL